MIKIFNNRLLLIICFFLSLGIIVSCNKDNDKEDGPVELLSFGPTGANHGDTLRFIGRNLDKVTSIVLTGATVNKDEFKKQTGDEIRIIVPVTAERGYVTLKTPEGDIVTKTRLNLGVQATITSMTPQARPGENITINGDYLNWVERITFPDDKVVTTFVSKAKDKIVVTVPMDAQTGPLTIFYGGTDSADVITDATLTVTLPQFTTISPNPVKATSDLTITGTDLDLVRQVKFNNGSKAVASANFISQSSTQIVVKVDSFTTKGKVTFVAPSGVEVQSAQDLDIILPTITSLAANPINLGSNLTITGTDLEMVKKVILPGVAPAITNFVSRSATQLVVTVPAGARSGKVILETFSGVQVTSSNNLTVNLPTITTLSPNPVGPGNNLTITGTGLDKITSVTFQNAPAVTSFVSKTASQIIVQVPNGVLRGKLVLGFSNPSDTIQSADILEIAGAVPPPTIALPFYNDAITSNWNGWTGNGWGGSSDRNNTSPVREGTKSVKIIYNSGADYGSPFQIGGGNISLTGYTTFKFSLFGAPGSNGKSMQINLNGANGPSYSFNVVEGKWTDYSIPLSSFTGLTNITEIWVQDQTGTGGYTVYLDALGLN